MAKFDKSVLATYGIQTGTAEVLYNPSYEVLFNEETKPGLEGYDKAQETGGRSQRDDWYLHRPLA